MMTPSMGIAGASVASGAAVGLVSTNGADVGMMSRVAVGWASMAGASVASIFVSAAGVSGSDAAPPQATTNNAATISEASNKVLGRRNQLRYVIRPPSQKIQDPY